MKAPKEILPPAWATRLLYWYCKPELAEDLHGDLHEYFVRHVKSHGPLKAKWIYIIDVFKFLRLYTLRKPEFVNLFIQWIMIGSYIKTSGRGIVRNKLFSTINIMGLAISMSVGLLLIGILSDVSSYDKFHTNHNRIYRVLSSYEYLGNKDDNQVATTSIVAGKAIRETFAGPEAVAILHREFDGDVKAGEKILPLNGYYANDDFFKVFSFKLLKGNSSTALKEPFTAVLTNLTALKLFGEEDPIGKTIILNERSFTISGVMEDIPQFSHIRFDMLGSLPSWEIKAKDEKRGMSWDNVWNTWVYVLLPEGYDPAVLKPTLDQLSAKEDPTVKYTHVELTLQPMNDIMMQDYSNEIGPTMGSSTLWIFGGLSFVVILSACFNYTNLSIARSLRRTREVGIRKVIGAMRGHVLGQFVVEAIIISLLSLVLSGILFFFLRPYFLGIEPSMQKILTLDLSPKVIAYFILFAVGVGVAAGFFPALFFSRINAVQVFKEGSSFKMFRKLTMRKILVVAQYCISIILITSTVIIVRQYKHFLAFDLGFNTANVLNINLHGNKANLLKKEIAELPEVVGISESEMITSVGNYYGTQMKYEMTPNDSAGIYYNKVDENYLPLHDHKLLAGRNFSPRSGKAEESEVIVNQAVLKRFNIGGQDPAKAIGEMVYVDKTKMQIIGVMKDFHYGRANSRNSRTEVVFRHNVDDPDYLNVKILSADWVASKAKLEAIWKKIDPVHPFEAKFYKEQLEDAYSGMEAAMKVAGFLAFLAICIASMGLLGMVVFTTETRLKEIGIRKVLGAGEARLLFLLGKGFLVLLAIATFIALPVTILFFEQVAFPELANHAPLEIPEMLLGVGVVMVIALIMIGTQTLKVAHTNPAEVLKAE